MKRTGWIAAAIVAITLTSCDSPEPQKESNTTLSGQLTGNPAGIFILEYLSNSTAGPVDTLELDAAGNFKAELFLEHSGFYRLRNSETNFINFILNPNDQAAMEGDGNVLGEVEFSQSPQTDFYHELLSELQVYEMKGDSLSRIMRAAEMQQDIPTYLNGQKAWDSLRDDYLAYLKSFTKDHMGEIVSVVPLTKLSPETDMVIFDKAVQALGEQDLENEYYLSLKQRVDDARKLAIGSPAPEITLPNPDGEIVPLSSLRGKYVLIDFWASWCKPCRRENPNVVKMYHEYKDKGFDIYSVSLDREKTHWKMAIEQDGLTWNHVSDLKYFQSEAAALYNIQGIPQTFLIDPDGNIIAKNLRGDALKQKLAEILG